MGKMLKMAAATAAVVLLASCAGRVPNQAGLASNAASTIPTTTPTYGATTPSYGSTTPAYGATDPYGSNAGYGSNTGYGANTGYGNTGMATSSQPLTATIEKVKNGSFLGIGKFIVTVKVMNPGTMPQTGTLKVSIMSSGKSIKDFTEPVSVPAGQTVTRTYEDPRAKADNATVSMMPNANADPYSAYGNTSAATGAMGSTGPYGMY